MGGASMSTKTIGLILIVLGVIIAVVSAAADVIGLGNQVQMGFGWRQQLGTAAGVVLALVGIWLATRKPQPKK